MRKLFFAACSLSLLLLASCGNEAADTHDAGDKDSMHADHPMDKMDPSKWETVGEKNGIRVSYFPPSPDFPDAKLTQLEPMRDPNAKKNISPGKVLFRYNVENFKLSEQTQSGHADHCANSAQGQHIHHILNGLPYTAHYTDTFSKDLDQGNYLSLSFLSRSYHESIKHKGAYQLTQFVVGMDGWKSTPYDTDGELLFYSRPKGEYAGKDTKIILLDFYLVNTDLSETGNKVRATINGNEFMLTRWVPYAVTGLPMGENTFKLELVDKDGKAIPGLYNVSERKITLKP